MIKQQLAQLIKSKDQIQIKIDQLTQQIQEINQSKNFDSRLVDSQGFPRGDLDFGELANFRNLKRQKAQLNNDHLKLMKEIQSKLFLYHETLPKVSIEQQQATYNFSKVKQEQKTPQITKQQQTEKKIIEKHIIDYLTPFAKITLVEANSPAEFGGLKVNDLLSEFSSINIYTPDGIKQIPTHVRQQNPIKIIVMRPIRQDNTQKYQKVFILKDNKSYAKLELDVLPQKWNGRGLLGCKIDPCEAIKF